MLTFHRLLLSNNAKFFDLLESSAEEAIGCVQALDGLFATPPNGRLLEEFMTIRHRHKQVPGQIVELLCVSFLTPYDREDIEAVSRRLYRIPKSVEKFSERLLLAQAHLSPASLRGQVGLLMQATQAVSQMVGRLRHQLDSNEVRLDNDQLQKHEHRRRRTDG